MLREIARSNAAEFRTAASELGEGPEAGGGSAKGAAGIREWAERSKRLILDPWFERLPLLSNSTSEHEVWYDEPGGTVYKRTWPGFHGQVPEIIAGVVSRRNATPQEYLIRQALQNEVFDSSMKLEGVHTANKPSMVIGEPAGLPSFVVSQHFEQAEDAMEKTPSLPAIASFMKENGFLPAPKSYFGWYRPSDGVVIVDAKPDNFVLQADGPVPIDLQMRQFTPEEMKLAGMETEEK